MYFLFEFQKPEKRVAKGGGRECPDSVSHSNFRKIHMSFVHQTVFHVLQIQKCTLQISCHPPLPFCKIHASCIIFRLNQGSCTNPFLPSENHILFWCHTPPSLWPPPPHPSSFSDSSSKACRDMKPLVFKRDNDSKVTLIVDSHLEHGPIFNVNITSLFMHKMTCDY